VLLNKRAFSDKLTRQSEGNYDKGYSDSDVSGFGTASRSAAQSTRPSIWKSRQSIPPGKTA